MRIELPWTFDTSLFGILGELSADDVFTGLLDNGLFCEKIPPCFTSEGLSEALDASFKAQLDSPSNSKLKKFSRHSRDYIRYESLRDINIPRHLGIPHPEAYANQALAIKKYWSNINEHNNLPSQEISRIYVRHTGKNRIFEMNYKGNERYGNEEQEIDWQAGAEYKVQVDITKCFPSIYSHSIPWALHGKDESKKNRELDLAGNLLDACTRNLKDAQTNGLLIGPHSSNIISEIILTRIDQDLLTKVYKKLYRHIDDYTFYSKSYDEAEKFIRDIGLLLREYELSINEKKTKIQPLPLPSQENWVAQLNRFRFSENKEIKYSEVRSFLDLALELALANKKSTPLNYAIQVIPDRLNDRAKRMFTSEAVNLALTYPYLTPKLEEHVFEKHKNP